MRPFFSISIPTWEIKGKGVEYLEFSFNRIASQSFEDYEVVISDHSVNDDIKNLCEEWKKYFKIVYVRNEMGRGYIAPNLNNAMANSTGEYIKILFQDDFLYDENSLCIVKNAILNSAKEVPWLVTGCCHTRDGENLYDQMIPVYNDMIHSGYNTISCPTVLTVKNDENTLSFNEELNWLVDVEYYKRCYLTFGPPLVVPDACVVNRDSEIRTTTMITEQSKQKEIKKMIERYG